MRSHQLVTINRRTLRRDRETMELTAMFIYGGYRNVLGTEGVDSSLINETYCGGGEVEAARALNCVAGSVDNAITPLLAEQDGPGVWYYDVAEPLGEWVAEAAAVGVCVDESDIVAKAVELTDEWLRELPPSSAATSGGRETTLLDMAYCHAIYTGGDTTSKLGMAEAMNRLPDVEARVINQGETIVLQVMYPAWLREYIRRIAPVKVIYIPLPGGDRW